MVEPLDGGVEGGAGGEGADMQLVHDGTRQVPAAPAAVLPPVAVLVIHPARFMHAVRLPPTGRIRPRRAAVEHKGIVGPGGKIRPIPPAVDVRLQWTVRAVDTHRHGGGMWCPDPNVHHYGTLPGVPQPSAQMPVLAWGFGRRDTRCSPCCGCMCGAVNRRGRPRERL